MCLASSNVNPILQFKKWILSEYFFQVIPETQQQKIPKTYQKNSKQLDVNTLIMIG
jgi:hypothetical protein